MKVTVLKEFRDISSFKMIHKVGDVLEVDKDRAAKLIGLGLVDFGGAISLTISLFEKEFEKKALVDALKTVGSKATGNMGEATLLGLVSELDEEATAKLKEALGIE